MARDTGEPEPRRFRKVQDVKAPSFLKALTVDNSPAIAFILWAVLLLVLSFQSGGMGVSVKFTSSDKLMHAVFYLPLGAALFWNFYQEKKLKLILFSVVLAGGYGLMIELVQGVLPWRNFELFDAMANISGATAGAALAAAFPRLPYIELRSIFGKTRTESP